MRHVRGEVAALVYTSGSLALGQSICPLELDFPVNVCLPPLVCVAVCLAACAWGLSLIHI